MVVTFGECRLDLDRRELCYAGRPIHLTPKAFELLRVLVESRGRALSKSELFSLIWPGVFVSDDSLGRLVAEVRSAIADSAKNPTWVRTIHGYGYSFAAPDASAESGVLNARYVLQCGSRQFPLPYGTYVIGRDLQSAIHMHSPSVSRRHACITVTSGGVSIQDLGSKNGTFVGDVKVNGGASPLRDGDRVRVGDFVLVLTSLTGVATETIPA